MDSETVVRVEGLAKKYCPRLRRAMWYGLRDLAGGLTGRKGRTALRAGEFWALKDIGFELKRGECLGVIGANGSGKSTLLKLLSGILLPDAGRIEVRGRTGALIEVGAGFHPMLTGRENIYVNGAILGLSKREIERRFDAIVEFSGIGEFLDTPVKFYSSGMYVRLGFAVAVHTEPDVLLADEVLAVGDRDFQLRCIAKLTELMRAGMSVMLVSHNLQQLAQLCSRALLLESGRMVFSGSFAESVQRTQFAHATSRVAHLQGKRAGRFGPRTYATLSQLEIQDECGQGCDGIEMGKALQVRVTLECRTTIPNAEIGVKIASATGANIHLFVSTWEGLAPELRAGQHIFTAYIPKIELFPGEYLVGAWVLRPPESSDDNVVGALKLRVFPAADRMHALAYASSGGEVYCRSVWTHTAVPEGAPA